MKDYVVLVNAKNKSLGTMPKLAAAFKKHTAASRIFLCFFLIEKANYCCSKEIKLKKPGEEFGQILSADIQNFMNLR